MGTKIQAAPPPADRDLGKEMDATLAAKLKYMPKFLEAEEQYRDRWADLDNRTFNRALEGTAEQPGLIATWRDKVMPGLSEAEATAARAQAEGRLGTVEQFGKRTTEALLGADAQKKALSDKLMAQANQELDLGATLDPALRREVQQAARAGQSARGMAYNPSSAAEETYFSGLKAEQLRRNRQQFAMGVLGQRQALTGDPSMMLLGQPSQVFSAAPTYAAPAGGMGQAGQMFQPGQYESNMFGMNYQGGLQNQALQTQTSMANAQNKAAMTSAVIGAFGSMAGGHFSAG